MYLIAASRKYEADYFTATILEWKHLLANDQFKDIVIGSMRHMVEKERAIVHAFVIMNNHMHLIWQILQPNKRDHVQRDMLKFTAQMIILELRNNDREQLQQYYVGAKDRKHQIWERNPLSVSLWSEEVVKQKLDYLHNNPVRAGLCARAEDYKYSNAAMYAGRPDIFGFITPFYF